MPNLLAPIQQAAIEAVKASNPAEITFGTVISSSPLRIKIDPKIILESIQIIVPKSLTDFEIEMTVDHFTENDAFMDGLHTHMGVHGETDEGNLDVTHKHAYIGKKIFFVHNALKNGDEVILLRMQGGQRYLVVDRTVKS